MKYCKNCGMLLEDTNPTCIRCGTDVNDPDNFSLFPIEVMESLDAQKEESKKRVRIIILIIVVFTLLVAVVAVGAVMMQKTGLSFMDTQKAETVEEVEEVEEEPSVEEVVEETAEEAEDAEAIAPEEEEPVEEVEEVAEEDDTELVASDREVNDAKGFYFNYSKVQDDVGNVLLNAVYPEDFNSVDISIDYGKYSTKFPISIRFVASGEDESVRFLYISPQQLWYKNSETGKTRNNERDISHYMSYYTYEDAKAYIVDMLKESYPKAKIELVNEEELSSEATESVKALANARSKYLLDYKGDYAHIGSDTTYAVMDFTYSACTYEYEITTSDKQIVFDKFYVPVVANNLYYASDSANDRGTVTEWYCLAFIALEAGNEDLYEDYAEDFDVFVANTVPTKTFMGINQLYGRDIADAIDSMRTADALTGSMLAEYTTSVKKGLKLSDFYTEVYDVLRSASGQTFVKDDIILYTDSKFTTAYIDLDNEKVFLSPDKNEYPGDEYEQLEAKSATDNDSNVADSTDEEEDDSDKTDKTNNKTDNKKSKGAGVN